MDFYRAQDEARRKTGQLVLLFFGAVATLVVLTNLLVGLVYVFSTGTEQVVRTGFMGALTRLPLETWGWVTLSVVGVVALACTYKFIELRGGGKAVAESLGGRQLMPTTNNSREKRLLNVVEEMALASGIPVPPVYLIPEDSINAFAAGFGTGDAVLGINRGTIDQLNRDELQGVVAHEFSHLLHGDTRINLRLIALLHGILFLGLIGQLLLRGSSRRSGRSSNGGGAPILFLGMGLLVIGYGGTFFGNLIKAAVSRQREYLADGSAVQFTRNPDGIAGALKKIGGSAMGSTMRNPRAAQASHMLFGQGIEHFLGSIMATHPPLPERIRAIEPGWDGRYVVAEVAETAPSSTERIDVDNVLDIQDRARSSFAGSANTQFDVLEQRVSEAPLLVGNPNDDSHDTAVAVLETTVAPLLAAAHQPAGARVLIYALLLSQDSSVRRVQLERLTRAEGATQMQELETLFAAAQDADDLHKLSLINAAMPALKCGSTPQYQHFLRTVTDLIKADERIDLFEWVMHRVLVKELKPHFERPRSPRWHYGTLSQVVAPCTTLVSALARKGNPIAASRAHSFAAGMQVLGFDSALDERADPNFVRLNAAINELRKLTPLAKPRIIKACAATVLADELVTVDEGALLQGVSATLDCPLPPTIYQHLQGQSTST
ncbi:MAG: M48 family metallopeptidase [Pseudomonadales bacterium]